MNVLNILFLLAYAASAGIGFYLIKKPAIELIIMEMHIKNIVKSAERARRAARLMSCFAANH